ncbi:hypothetical protein IQ215_01810 [Cyanobacterium stanieri LEGE 03274]|uniref:Phage protein n=1 Tax=Cyanobacterium stanieri LEGE 03274 TaxID=1828756 RepID=A0ABR9V0P5_9CHRO|nr:hypothetical protein [Cyanobacterium stanieri]MBE9221422.1 hypothetical protein [Cyanobacterium stanieri LEGE 03274]
MDNNLKINNPLVKLDEKINLAIKKALEKHQKLGESVVISENGENKIYTGSEIKILLDKYQDD